VIYAQRYSWNGAPLLTAGGKRITDASQDAYYLAMTKDGVGGLFITYLYGYTLRAIAVKGNGAARWDSSAGTILCNAARERYLGGIVQTEPGRAVVVWYDYRDYNASNYDCDIYAQTIDTLGQLGWALDGVPVGVADRMQIAPVVVPTVNRGVIAAWWDDRSGSGSYPLYRVYAQRVNASGGLTGISSELPIPTETVLLQNYPNPFNPSTEIRFRLQRSLFVSLTVVDLLGRQVATLIQGPREAGEHALRFDATGLASGIYLCRLQAGDASRTMKMLLLR
jgi:hypothetical protein